MRIIVLCIAFILNTSVIFCQKMAAADVVDKVISGVVTVAIYQSDIVLKPLGFRGNPSDIAYSKALDLAGAQSSGSGFVIKQNNKYYIITNAHVVQKASDEYGSVFIYSIYSTKYEAKVLGGDSFYDLAVLEFKTIPGNEISPVIFRKSDTRVGETVYAIGNPLGDYPYTVSNGIISAKNRIRGGMTGRFGFLQSTATVIWGNSGGPLVDVNGDVVGINSKVAFTEMDGKAMWLPHINFALESGICLRLISDIINNGGLIKRAYFGVEINKESLIESKGSYYKAVANQSTVNQLPIIGNIIPGSPADAELNKFIGYKIDVIDDTPIKTVQDALSVFEKVKPGKTVTFTLSKQGQVSKIKVKSTQSDASANSQIGNLILNKMGCKILSAENNMLSVSFPNSNISAENSGAFNETINLGTKTKVTSNLLFKNDWTIIGGGVYSEDNSQVWTIKDATDAGTILRLCGENGFIDLILLKKGADPKVSSNYLVKRLIFSENNYIRRQSLWY